MGNESRVTDELLKQIREELEVEGKVKAWQIKEALGKKGFDLDESTIRGRFIEMGNPLSGGIGKPQVKEEVTTFKTMITPLKEKAYEALEELKVHIPKEEDFISYIVRPIDRRIALHYNLGKYPLTQGKQGTGKTFSHEYYAFSHKLPFFLYSCYEDFKLEKLFGDKTIKEGTVIFQESLFVKAIQGPSVILFDEINAISNANTFPFHALLQNRQLFIKDANDGKGKLYKLHQDCKIGFAQNPKSVKYVGGNIKASNFLGRCTYITYPEFTKTEISEAIMKRFPSLHKEDLVKFVTFYFASLETIDRTGIPVDISIRQLNNVIDLWIHGAPLNEAIEDGMTSLMEAISQPKAKEAFYKLSQSIWKEIMEESKDEKGTVED